MNNRNIRCIKVLTILPGFIPSTVIGVVQPLLDLQAKKLIKFRVALEILAWNADIYWADVIVFCRNVEPKHRSGLDTAIKLGKPIIYELDDNLFEVPGDSEVAIYHQAPERLAMLKEYIENAHLVRVYADPVMEHCLTINSNTVKVFAPVDWQNIKPGKKSKKLKIIYATSRDSDDLWKLFWPGLQKILKEFPEQVDAYFWGPLLPVEKLTNVHFIPPINDYTRYLRTFSEKGFDIGLAPLMDDNFHRSKTNNKFREYGICKIAGIYSDVNVYNNWIQDGETGLLVQNDPEAWYDALRKLITDHGLRTQIQDQSYEFVREKFRPEVFSDIWLNHLNFVLEQSTRSEMRDQPDSKVGLHSTTKRNEKISFTARASKRFLQLFRDSPQQLTRLISWMAFNIWTMIRINIFKDI